MRCQLFFAALLLAVLPASLSVAQTFSNTDFSAPGTVLADVTRNPITLEPANSWILGGNDDADRWDIVGGVASNNASGGEAQGMYQYIMDNQASTGTTTFDFEVNYGAATGDLDLHLYVFGWNVGDTAPGVDLENGTAETGDSFIPQDSVNLITDPTGPEGRFVVIENDSPLIGAIADDGLFDPVSVNVDLGTGYDFLGALFYAENSGGTLEIDNANFAQAVVPEPASIAVWTLIGLIGGFFGVRRFRKK